MHEVVYWLVAAVVLIGCIWMMEYGYAAKTDTSEDEEIGNAVFYILVGLVYFAALFVRLIWLTFKHW